MKSLTEVDNQTDFKIEGIPGLVQDFLEQLDFPQDTEVSIVLCDNDFIRDLNRTYREMDYPTDVLSFPTNMKQFLGDIVISLDKAKEQAVESPEKELEMLLAHGLLHLLGYDHEESDEAYEKMMKLQEKLLKNKRKESKIKWA
jgi:probable rRNA maturation factor